MDLTYPLTTQSLIFDGSNMTFSTFQLNTLSMWQIDAKQRKQNLCWVDEERTLLRFDDRGNLSEVDGETLAVLLKFLLRETNNRNGLDLRPFLEQQPSPRHKIKQFNFVDEERMEPFRPGSRQYPRYSTYYYSHIP